MKLTTFLMSRTRQNYIEPLIVSEKNIKNKGNAQLSFTCPKSAIEALE